MWSRSPRAFALAGPWAREQALAAIDLGVSSGDVTPEVRRRIRIISIATVAMFSIGIGSVFHYWQLDLAHLCVALIVTMCAACANLALLRATRRPQLCGHIGLALLASLLLISNLTSGGF